MLTRCKMICELKSLTFADSEVRAVQNATSLKVYAGLKQACCQVWRFGGQNKLLVGQDFCFYYSICFKQTFLGTKKLGTLALNVPMAMDLE